MKFSTRVLYGCRAMVDLARRGREGTLPLRALAEGQHMPERYLSKIIQDLRRSGLIRSVRGAHGGYVLSRPADEITLLDVWEALEGPIRPVDCLDTPDACNMMAECLTRDVWDKLRGAFVEVLASETIGGLVRRRRRKARR